jgi:hypothetical protein
VNCIESLFAQIVPGAFTGARDGDWIRILRRVGFLVGPDRLCRFREHRLGSSRQLDAYEEILGVEIVFARFIDDP